jgi:hypothetical protein
MVSIYHHGGTKKPAICQSLSPGLTVPRAHLARFQILSDVPEDSNLPDFSYFQLCYVIYDFSFLLGSTKVQTNIRYSYTHTDV